MPISSLKYPSGSTSLKGRSNAVMSSWTLFETALTLVSAMDERSSFTAGRTKAVVALARSVAIALGTAPEEIERLEWACLYCDLGMLALPDALLQKPESLTVQEQALIRSHVHLSLQMIANNPPPVAIADLVAAHHERYDGGGYPRGLRGAELPVLANVLSAADTLVSLASDRPWRRGCDAGMIAQILHNERGRQFYPEIVDALEGLDLTAYLALRRKPVAEARLLKLDVA